MTIQLTDEQWANVCEAKLPVRVSGPARQDGFVLVRAEDYERFKPLFEEDPMSIQERQFQLQQFGRRAGWNDPSMDVYDDLDPRRKP